MREGILGCAMFLDVCCFESFEEIGILISCVIYVQAESEEELKSLRFAVFADVGQTILELLEFGESEISRTKEQYWLTVQEEVWRMVGVFRQQVVLSSSRLVAP